MADISVTAASVQQGTGATVNSGIAGGTITAGQPLYKDASASNTLKPAQATSAAAASAVGIAAHGAANGQRILYYTRNNVLFNAVLTAGQVYVVSAAAAGGIAPVGDLGSGNFTTILGVATSTTNLKLGVLTSGVAKP